jgi:hypothetical protein
MGVFFALVTVAIFIIGIRDPNDFITLMINPEQIWWMTLEEAQFSRVFVVFGILLGSVIGLMAWRIVCVGIYVLRLGRRFNLAVQLNHPDTCGGLKSLGTLCLWNALIVTIPAVYLGFWIIFPGKYEYWIPYLRYMLLVPLCFATESFLLPLWSIHKEMVDRRNETQEQRNQLSQNIDSLTQEVSENSIENFDKLTSSEHQSKLEQINYMQDTYMQLQNSPVWPLDKVLVRRFMVSQTIPFLTTLGILTKDTPEIVESLFEFLK